MIVLGGQNIFDIAISTGNVNNLMFVLAENNLNPDSELTSGQKIIIPELINKSENYIISSFQNLENVFEYIIKSSQNIFDVTIQYFGDISKLFDFIGFNNLSIQQLNSGQKVLINNFQQGNETIKRFVKLNNLIICNSSKRQDLTQYLATEDEVIIDTEDGQGILI